MIMINVEKLGNDSHRLISTMEDMGYSETYIARISKEINRIIRLTDLRGWSSYLDVYHEYEKSSQSQGYLRDRRGIIRIIEQFDVCDSCPDGSRKSTLFSRSAYHRLIPEFKAVIDCYLEVVKTQDKKDTTARGEGNNTSTFFLNLQNQGFGALEEITESAVLSMFTTPDGNLNRSCSYKKNIAAVLKASVPAFPALAQILNFLPELRETRKNIQYLTSYEISKVKDVLLHESRLSLRNKAIGMLALCTGLRCCDIAGLKMDSVDWSSDIITVKQQKTEIALVLPLSAMVGNALYDYLVGERPDTDCPYLFISKNRPYGRMNERSLHGVSVKIMNAAGIRQDAEDRKGLHLFRHRLAVTLLENEIPQPVISKTLGHTSPDSLEPYLRADFAHLKECALSIDRFPVAKEVFCRG
jgi:integrase